MGGADRVEGPVPERAAVPRLTSRASDPQDPLERGLSRVLRRNPTAGEIAKFRHYLSLLLRWDRVHRLTGYRRPGEIVEKLFLDSLLFLRLLPPGPLRLLDLGAGAGVPGIPLKIAAPDLALTLVEARRNRANFLALVVRELELKEVSVLWGRAERVLSEKPELGEAFDVVLTRAAGPLPTVIPLALGFLRPEGIFIASGPPANKPAPKPPDGVSAHWKQVPSPLASAPRQFLVVRKGN